MYGRWWCCHRSSTDSTNNWKLADFQFHLSSVRDGAFSVVTWQSTVMSMGRWSEPRHSVVLHSTRSNKLLWTRVTSGGCCLRYLGWSLLRLRRSRCRNIFPSATLRDSIPESLQVAICPTFDYVRLDRPLWLRSGREAVPTSQTR